MMYRVRHSTVYHAPSPVTMSIHQAHLTPRPTPGQRVMNHWLEISPTPADRADHIDLYGNRCTYFSIEEPHQVFEVVATSEVELLRSRALTNPAASWEQALAHTAASPLDRDFTLESPLIPHSAEAAEYALPSFAPGRPLLESLTDLNRRIFLDFSYRPGWTTIATPVSEVLATRSGVCQDFAHVLLDCVRSLGLAGRYVSGYVENVPPAGEPVLAGADASHAWASVQDADGRWIDLDPTNGLVEPASHITIAWGRDYSDVVPLKGVVTSVGGPTEMEVDVTVERVQTAADRQHCTSH